MHKRLAEIIDYLEAGRGQLLATVSGIDPSFAELRPRSGSWSVAEIINHLAIVESRIATLVFRSVVWAKEKAIGPELSESSMLSSLDECSIIEGGRTIAAPPQISPSEDSRMDEGLDALVTSRRELKKALEEADGIDLTLVSRPHPVFGDLNLYQWAVFVAQHEMRHTLQIVRTLRELTEAAAGSAPMF